METWPEKVERLKHSPRLRALEERLSRLEAGEGTTAARRRTVRALRLLMVDATLEGDIFTLDAAVDGLRRLEQVIRQQAGEPDEWQLLGHVEGLREHAVLALERVPPLHELAAFEPDGQAAAFLHIVAEDAGVSSSHVCESLGGVAPSRVSVLGRELEARGLLRKRRIGRRNAWDITPRGMLTLQLVQAGGAPRPQREHRLPALG